MGVLKIRKPRGQWAVADVPEYLPDWYFKFRWRGKQFLRNAGTTIKAEAEKLEAALLRQLKSANWQVALDAMEGAKLRRTLASIGDLERAYLDPGVKLLKDEKQLRRNINDLFLVLAWSLDLWAVHEGGIRGIKIGARVPDRRKIGALSATVLTGKLVKDYFRAKQGGILNLNEELEGNGSINSTLGHARDVFSPRAMSYKFEGLSLPDLSGFLEEPLLPEVAAEPAPVKEAEFLKLLAAANGLPRTDDLWLVNLIFRQTGMRSGSVVALQKDWLEKLRDGWWCHVRVRKGKTALYSVPVSDELAAIINGREGFTILPLGSDADRAKLVNGAHNEFLKRIIGGAGERTQGNHRMRDTVACILKSWLGMEVAAAALGHADAKTTMKHYARLRMDVSAEMKRELGAFQRLQPKVVAFLESKKKGKAKQG